MTQGARDFLEPYRSGREVIQFRECATLRVHSSEVEYHIAPRDTG